MAEPPAGIKEIEHTADLGVEITATPFPALLAASGEALFALIADLENIEIREAIVVSASGDGRKSCFAWLCELLAKFNIEGLLGKNCAIDQITADRVDGRVRGEKLDLIRHGFRTEIGVIKG